MSSNELIFKKYIPYVVDFDYLEESVEFLVISSNKKVKNSIKELMVYFADKKIIEPVYTFASDITVKCENLEYTIECKNDTARQILTVLLNLQNKKEPIYSPWYFYDHNSCNEMPHIIHSFFLAVDNRIVLENAIISTFWMNDSDPNILVNSVLTKCQNSSIPLWDNEERDQKAMTLWYYQKFYKETHRGQILSIREHLLSNKKTKSYSSLSYHTLVDQISLLQSINKKIEWVAIILAAMLFNMIFG